MAYLCEACDQISDFNFMFFFLKKFLILNLEEKNLAGQEKKIYSDLTFSQYNHIQNFELSRQTGSRNLMVPKTLPTIWLTYVKLVTKYQISAINSC
jgi:hypothetical protein